MKGIFLIKKNKNKKYVSLKTLFEMILIIKIVNYAVMSECGERENPFKKGSQCVSSCTTDEISNNECIVKNDIIAKQWLNNIIYLDEIDYRYTNIVTSEKNNLYLMTSTFPESNSRIFYLLNSGGYSLVSNENQFLNIELEDSSISGRFESTLFEMKFYESVDDKEYLVSISKSAQYMEIYDFLDNKRYFEKVVDIFGLSNNNYQYIGVTLKLKLPSKENKNSYLISFLGTESDTNGDEIPYVYLFITRFSSIDIKNHHPTLIPKKFSSSLSKVVSCYETGKNFLICFYQNPAFEYIMIVFDYEFDEKTHLKIADGYSGGKQENEDDWFFKCVHFFDEVGAFGYFKGSVFHFEFKEYINSTIVARFQNSQIKLNNYEFNKGNPTFCDMIKIKDKKFYFAGISSDKKVLILVCIFNYDKEKLSKRLYTIAFKNLYNHLFSGVVSLALYNNLLAMGSTYFLPDWKMSSSLIIFSYPQTEPSSTNIIAYLYSHNETKIYDLQIELEGKFNRIDNNIFGLVYSGVKIIGNCEDLENIYLADLNDNKLTSDYYLLQNEKIKLKINKQENYSLFTCQFQYAVTVSEPEFSEFNNYPVEYLDTGNENKENEFFEAQKTNYTGKSNTYKIILDYELTHKDCGINCELCKSHEEDPVPECVSCKYLSHFDENDKKICDNNTEIDNPTETEIPTEIDIPTVTYFHTETDSPTQTDTPTETDISTEEDHQTEISTFPNKSDKINSDEISNEIIDKNTSKICEFDEIIDNRCSNEITNNQIKEVYSYIKANLINGNYTLIKTDNVIFEVSEIKDQMNLDNKDISNVDLGKCEQRLKIKYNISESKELIIFKVDIKDLESSTTYVQYEVYHPDTHTKLELDICEDLNINIFAPIYLDNETSSLFSNLKESGYNLFDSKDSFYNDICCTFTTSSGLDMLLSDRQKDIYKKYGTKAFCQKDCEFEYYNETTQKQKCNCNAQLNSTNLDLDLFHTLLQGKDKLQQSFFNTINNANFQVMKCFKIAIDLNTIFINIGRMIMTFIVLIVFILLFFYIFSDNKKLEKYLTQILTQKMFNNKINKNSNSRRKLSHKSSIFPKRKLNKKSTTILRKNKKSATNFPRKLNKKSTSILPRKLDSSNPNILQNKLDKVDEPQILNMQKSNLNIKKKRRAYSYHKKRGLTLKLNNNQDDDKENTPKINSIGLKKFPPQTNKNILDILNINNKEIKDNLNSDKNPHLRRMKSSNTIKLKFNNENIPQQNEASNFAAPLKKKSSLKIRKTNNNNNPPADEKTASHQNIIFSNNIYIKLNNKHRNKNKKLFHKSSKDSFISSRLIDNNLNKSLDSSEKIDIKNNIINQNFTNQELNTMNYKKALIYDKRTFFQFYWSLLKKKQIILFVLFNEDDYNLISVKIILFFISFSLYFTLNGFFFNDNTMHKLYQNNGSYDFLVQIPIICYSTMTTALINIILKTLSLSERFILEIKRESSLKKAKMKSMNEFPCLKLKILIFFILSAFLILFFWYFISCFCGVYRNTQIILIKDTILSFGLSMIYPFGIYLIPGILRLPSLKSKDKECLYKTSVFISLV